MLPYLLIFILLYGCASRQTAVADYEQLRFARAEEKLSDANLPYTRSKDAVWLTLDRAMVRWVHEREECLEDFSKALDAIDYYRQKTTSEEFAKTIFQDGLGAYQSAPYENSLARLYYAFALLQKGEEENAAALLYYLENHLEEDINRDGKKVTRCASEAKPQQADSHLFTVPVNNPIAAALLALLLERRGDVSNAEVLYRRLRISPKRGRASLLCLFHTGLVPKKVSTTAPASIVSAAVLEAFLGMNDVRPALSTLRGIPVPKLAETPPPPDIRLQVDGADLPFSLVYDIKGAAERHLEKEMPQIALRGAARLILRRAAVASSKKHHDILDVAIWIANAATEADTRSWGTLPSRLGFARLDLEPGFHTLVIDGQPHPFTLREGDLHIVHIVRPQTHKTIILEKT